MAVQNIKNYKVMHGEFNSKVIRVLKGTMQKPNKEEKPRKSMRID